jgi:5'(3')-deoxyribonucleotidase
VFENLTDENYLLYAIKAYDKPECVMSELNEDLKRFNYLKRLFFRYRKKNDLKERLILNHLVVLYNVFGVEPTTRLLFFSMNKSDYSSVKTFLLFLNYMPYVVIGIKNKNILSSEISVDMNIANVLRQIK